MSLSIHLSEQELTETRTYIKLISVIGDVGGFMEVIFSLFSVLASILTGSIYTKSLVNYLFSFDLDKKLILVKKKDLNLFKTQKSQRIYTSDNILKININKNNNEEEQNKIKDMKNNNKGNNNDDVIIKKQEAEQNFFWMDKKIELYKNIKYNLAFDKDVKPSNFFQEKSNSYRSRSNRKIDFKFNSQIEKNMSEGNRCIEKENNLLNSNENQEFNNQNIFLQSYLIYSRKIHQK